MLLQRGAEAEIWLDREQIRKVRIRKGYRIRQLDEKIRQERTRLEASLLRRARRAGIRVPRVLETSGYEIRMEWIRGERLKEWLRKADRKERKRVFAEIGRMVAGLHHWGIVHGDLTTSNFILGDGVYLIDFGLGRFSKRVEDQAIDLLLLYEAIRATHFSLLKEAWKTILKEYKANYSNAPDVLRQLEKIKRRRRYM
ncbi:MAG: Kae1-associated kinase Bud32 [Candidatus Aenigmatarchaeota archaeon]|nr:MAG: Kae1-associated kinase Bud32 [Candidatus Aenigmarchaeota archaeon]